MSYTCAMCRDDGCAEPMMRDVVICPLPGKCWMVSVNAACQFSKSELKHIRGTHRWKARNILLRHLKAGASA